MTTHGITTDAVQDVVRDLDQAWRNLGVVRSDREAMTGQILPDLLAASGDGIDPRVLLTPDVATFAAAVARERGASVVRVEFDRMIVGGIAGAAAVLVVCWVPMVRIIGMVTDVWFTTATAQGWGVIAVYVVLAALCLAGAVTGLGYALRDAARRGPTLWRSVLLLAVAGTIVTPLTMGFAFLTGYDSSLPVVAVEIGMVLGAAALALRAARAWALRGALDT